MANKRNTGFRPASEVCGRIPIFRFPVDASSGTALYVGDVVANNAAGSVRPAAANAGVTAAGVCVAVYDSDGRPCGSQDSSVSTPNVLTASTAGYADVALALPGAIFRANFGATYTPTAADIFGSVDHVATAGDATVHRSNHVLGGAGGINTEAQFQILGLVNDGNNAWGTYAEVYVRFLESCWGQVNPTVGV